jgi:hypothetical protein
MTTMKANFKLKMKLFLSPTFQEQRDSNHFLALTLFLKKKSLAQMKDFIVILVF